MFITVKFGGESSFSTYTHLSTCIIILEFMLERLFKILDSVQLLQACICRPKLKQAA